MKKIVVSTMLLLFTQVGIIMAQKPGVVVSTKEGWHKISQISADFKLENESIFVFGADKFKSIKLKVKDASINILTLKVYYESGEVEEIPVKSELKAGTETRVMNVKEKDIKKVGFTYKTIPNSKDEKAEVELYGLK